MLVMGKEKIRVSITKNFFISIPFSLCARPEHAVPSEALAKDGLKDLFERGKII
jgi:hypothetical protein